MLKWLDFARSTALVVVVSLCSTAAAQEQRWIMHGEVNGISAKLAVDTGTSFPLAMAQRDLNRFGLTLEQKSAPGTKILKGFSNPFTIKLPPNHKADNVRFAVFEDPPPGFRLDFDAIFGWSSMRRMQFRFRKHDAKEVRAGEKLSPAADAAAFPMLPSEVLMFDADPGAKVLPVLIDTGWSGGVQLSSKLWKPWRANNARPSTLHTVFSPQHGRAVMEQVFAPALELGSLKLRYVIVSEIPPSIPTGSLEPDVVLGLDAFANHELLIDGPADKVFIGKPEPTLLKPSYNRLGASFDPDTKVASVAPGSPAALAGIEDGDILQLLNGMEPGQYAAQRPGRSIWELPAGTRIELTLVRAGIRIEREVTLQDFMEP